MKTIYAISFFVCIHCLSSNAQSEVALTRKGNRQYNIKSYKDAEISYRKALETNPDMHQAAYNLAVSMQQQKKTEEALDQYIRSLPLLKDSIHISHLYHNVGNIYLKSDKIEEAIKAYKSALLFKPNDSDTRYNLSYALNKRKKQQEQQEQQQSSNNDQKDNQDQKEQDKNQQSKSGDKSKEKESDSNKKDGQNNNEQNSEKSKQDKPQPSQMSKEQLKKMLESVEARENKVQEKSKNQEEKGLFQLMEKDW